MHRGTICRRVVSSPAIQFIQLFPLINCGALKLEILIYYPTLRLLHKILISPICLFKFCVPTHIKVYLFKWIIERNLLKTAPMITYLRKVSNKMCHEEM